MENFDANISKPNKNFNFVDFPNIITPSITEIDFDAPEISETISTKAIIDSIQKINNQPKPKLNIISSNVVFDKSLNIMVVEIKDNESGELIKTIPSHEMLEFFKKVSSNDGKLSGNIIDLKV